jgi:Uma2 family endonuclease
MAASATLDQSDLTLADLLERFGPMPYYRIRHDPPPGTATEQDVIDVHDREDRLCELVDGVLVEKTMGLLESFLALELGALLRGFVSERGLGIAVGADGTIRLAPGLVRIPDVAFFSWNRLPGRKIPREPIPDLVPDLAVEVLSKSNTKQEMDRKLADYFTAGVRVVWYIDPEKRTAEVFSAPDRSVILQEKDSLEGGDVLSGFSLPLADLFREIEPPSTKSTRRK